MRIKDYFKQRKYREFIRNVIYSCNKRQLVHMLSFISKNSQLTEKSRKHLLLIGLKRVRKLPKITRSR